MLSPDAIVNLNATLTSRKKEGKKKLAIYDIIGKR